MSHHILYTLVRPKLLGNTIEDLVSKDQMR
jgi:hypothetical protein